MTKSPYKPAGYNSASPYFILEDADRSVALMQQIFDAKMLREYRRPDGNIMHAELQIDDSVIMLSNASERFPPVPIVMHVYVPDVDKIWEKVLAAGCEAVEPPKERGDDSDRRATFKDYAGNMWSIGTQLESNT
ncbi:VOC family protein [Lunatimonas salinarum]|uniref:VOC family protein n=1 Tax=Lunatimonas salinarum TaxID=1774590 RepID=UPI001ADFD538|nr:VOC family protein [Lunatimonas salinarum]